MLVAKNASDVPNSVIQLFRTVPAGIAVRLIHHYFLGLRRGRMLPMTREDNPYRSAGVTILMAAVCENLRVSGNELVVELE